MVAQRLCRIRVSAGVVPLLHQDEVRLPNDLVCSRVWSCDRECVASQSCGARGGSSCHASRPDGVAPNESR